MKVLFVAIFIISICGTVSAAGDNNLKVTSTDPANNSVNFPTTKDITVKYSSSVTLGDKQPELISQSGKNVSTQSDIYNGILYIHHPKLEVSTKYNLNIPAGAFKDSNGNLCSSYLLTFTTSSLSINPKVTGSYPVNGSKNFPFKTDISIYYNKQVQLETNKAELVNSKGIKIPILISVNKKTVSVYHKTLTPNTYYKLTLFNGCIADMDGNYCFKYILSFKTMKKLPYLKVSDVTSNSAAMQTVKYKIPYILKNTGVAAAKNFKIRIYLTPSKSIKGIKYLIGEQLIKYLAPGKTIKLN